METSITRTFSVGRSASERAKASSAATPVALSLAPGTVPRSAMSASAAADSAASAVPALIRVRLSGQRPGSDQQRGSATTGAIRGGLVSTRSISHGKRPNTRSGIAGWYSRPACAAS